MTKPECIKNVKSFFLSFLLEFIIVTGTTVTIPTSRQVRVTTINPTTMTPSTMTPSTMTPSAMTSSMMTPSTMTPSTVTPQFSTTIPTTEHSTPGTTA